MRTGLRRALIAVAAVAVVAALWTQVPPASSQSDAYQAPRTADGVPDLNGIWQAVNTANYDIQSHAARPAMALVPAPPRAGVPGLVRATPADLAAPPVRALGAAGGVPAGEGVVEGHEIPYQPWAAAKKKENSEHWLERDPEIKCYHAWCASRDLYAVSLSDPAGDEQDSDRLRVCAGRRARFTWTRWETVRARHGWAGRAAAGRERRWWSTSPTSTTRPGSTAPGTSTATHCMSSSAIRRSARTTSCTKSTIEDPKVFTRPWKMSMPLYRRFEKDKQILEYKCVEFVEELMYGHLGVIDPATGQANK